MTNVGEDTQPTMCYPQKAQHAKWKQLADERGYKSLSRFIIQNVERGYKNLNLNLRNGSDELRKQRNDLKRELDQTRLRLQEVEEQLYRGERESVLEFLEHQSGGATFPELVQHIIDDAPVRVAELVDQLDGDEIEYVDGEYRLVGGTGDD
ncbi:hypothetical protein [Haloarchaeobius amylolyticus]|uniref:hypothetical protein n=1 Tax=Haloarchaeobius amylolyticus TaxID=1198296 RepID=UPI00226EA669|nr:hypothetical protein [Haloarchaeobius amylolyticus]